jgi:hypothetical protein
MEKLIGEIFDDFVDVSAELSGYTETLNLLQTKICLFDGSEDRGEFNLTVDALHALWRSMERFQKAWNEKVSGYAKRRHQLGKASKHFDPIRRLEKLGIKATRNGKGQEWVKILDRHGVTSYADFPLSRYSALEADLIGLVGE